MIKLYDFDSLKPEEILNRDIRAEKNVEDVVDAILADVRTRGDEGEAVPSLPTVAPLRCTWTFLSTLMLFDLTTAVPSVRHCGSFASFFMMFALPDFVPTMIGLPALSVM